MTKIWKIKVHHKRLLLTHKMKSTKKRPHDQVVIQSKVPAKNLRSKSECHNVAYRKDSSYVSTRMSRIIKSREFGKGCKVNKLLESSNLQW